MIATSARPARAVTLARGWRMKLSKAMTEFLTEIRVAKSPATVTAYESDLVRLKGYLTQDTVLHFTAERLRAYFVSISEQGLKMSTLHRKRACFNEFGKWGVRRRYWTENPVNDLVAIRRPEHVPRPFSHDEQARLLALELPVEEDLIRALLFYTGLRVTPLCTIRVGDLSFDPPTIRAVVKGGRTQVVRVHDQLRDKLYAYVTSLPAPRPSTPLFAYRNGRPFQRRAVERMTRAWGAAAKVPDCTPHRFRHSFACALAEGAVGIHVIKEAMGHRDINSTMAYTKVTNAMLDQAIATLPWGRPA